MPNVANPFEEWLPRVAGDSILVDNREFGLKEEAGANHWSFGVTAFEASSLSVDDVLRFLRSVRDARERQISERLGKGHPMVYYVWHSVQTAQINLGLLSESHDRLPFGASVELVGDLREIVQAFLTDACHDGIPIVEFRMATQEDLDAVVEPERHVVRVWTDTLPRGGE